MPGIELECELIPFSGHRLLSLLLSLIVSLVYLTLSLWSTVSPSPQQPLSQVFLDQIYTSLGLAEWVDQLVA
jgi:multisubunit Na+/H+ antiporter MnhB subunit